MCAQESKNELEKAAAAPSNILTRLPFMSGEMLRAGFFITLVPLCATRKARLQMVLQAMTFPDVPLREIMFLMSRFGIIKSCSKKRLKSIYFMLNKDTDYVMLFLRIYQNWLIGDTTKRNR